MTSEAINRPPSENGQSAVLNTDWGRTLIDRVAGKAGSIKGMAYHMYHDCTQPGIAGKAGEGFGRNVTNLKGDYLVNGKR